MAYDISGLAVGHKFKNSGGIYLIVTGLTETTVNYTTYNNTGALKDLSMGRKTFESLIRNNTYGAAKTFGEHEPGRWTEKTDGLIDKIIQANRFLR